MSFGVLALITICSATVIGNALLNYRWFFKRVSTIQEAQISPNVAVLVAARDEEQNIAECIESLLHVEYPKDKLEIWVGNDQSTDNTKQIVADYAAKNQTIHLLDINENLGQARGKANVLAHLARHAKGDLLFITDADIAVPPTWIRGMLRGLKPNVGIVNGFTYVAYNDWQNMDWLFALGMVKVIADMGRPVTAMGNNMLVTREAYDAVGGYESIPFSITEDFELFRQVKEKGYSVVQQVDPEVTASTKPQPTFVNLLNQRKRWMSGAVKLPWPIVTLLSIQALYFPAWIALALVESYAALLIFGLKVVLQSAFIRQVSLTIQSPVQVSKTMLYEGYSFLISMSTALFYLMPLKIRWKGREY